MASGRKRPQEKGREARKTAKTAHIRSGSSAPTTRRRSDDGLRILIDRLWPRGLRSQSSSSMPGSKQLSPSNELRKWYQHDPEKFAEFRKRYVAELSTGGACELRDVRAAVTLLTPQGTD